MAKIKGKLQVITDKATGREYCIPVPVHEKPSTTVEHDKWQSSHNKNKNNKSQKTSP